MNNTQAGNRISMLLDKADKLKGEFITISRSEYEEIIEENELMRKLLDEQGIEL